ncbi:hypothetical protein ACE1ET_15945 [Saccharicrinis sp. FJH62]|uniref:hypothetical protein n=1 Tax=Saccharicrinis sp. FJH62 TaxID=3344657 RepID=UPI0035D4B1D4
MTEDKVESEVEVIDSQGCDYLDEFMEDLPDNCMLNKVMTGCGGTSLALKNSIPYVICVPYINLIKNKLDWADDKGIKVCQVMGSVTDDEIINFTGIKYLVTYDSLHRLMDKIETAKFKILIDESHKLVDSAIFREKAVDNVLNYYNRFRSYCFMTSTPVKQEYQLPELKHIPLKRIHWEKEKRVQIYHVEKVDQSLERSIAIHALNHLEDPESANAHFFYNSVNSVIDVVRFMKKVKHLNSKQVSITLANTKENETKIFDNLGDGFKNSLPGKMIRKINFYTSTAFEGCDIYDPKGLCYIVADGTKDSTKYDISTIIPQTIGRIRDSKYKDSSVLIFRPYPNERNLSENDYSVKIRSKLVEAQGLVDLVNEEIETNPDSMYAKTLNKGLKGNHYIKFDDGKYQVNSKIWHNKMHNYSAQFIDYQPGAFRSRNGEQRINNIIYEFIEYDLDLSDSPLNRLVLDRRVNFSDLMKEYCERMEEIKCAYPTNFLPILDLEFSMKKRYPLIVNAYKKIGPKTIKALKYRKKKIELELVKQDRLKSNEVKIASLLNFKSGDEISNKDLKEKLQDVFNALGIVKTAKATDVKTYYDVQVISKNSRSKHYPGLRIIDCKIKII